MDEDDAEMKKGSQEPALVVVESPAKAKTIMKLLGRNYQVKATIGHIKDLPKSKIGIDIENGFKPLYQVIPGKDSVINDLKSASERASVVYLAADPDREGEAIAWHIADEIRPVNQNIFRVLFNEITKKGIEEGINNPHSLNTNKLNSQQARRILDRLVGYKISPLLWQKVRRGLSAGRVQSVAVRLICERDAEIKAFKSEEYWSVEAIFRLSSGKEFEAKLFKIKNDKFELKSEAEATDTVKKANGESYRIVSVQKKQQKRNPSPPFITSTLQQEAARKLNFTAKRTMLVAQQLYEGVELGERGLTGLLTYIRTDSVRLSDEAIEGAREYIKSEFGKEYLPEKPNVYKSKRQTQDAHEAIRPTLMDLPPPAVKRFLKKEQFLLYQIIWNRFIASQMQAAVYDQTSADILGGDFLFRANGRVLKFDGFIRTYTEGTDDLSKEDTEGELPELTEGETPALKSLTPNQHFTQPPPRYTEASLVKSLEENGIGRPSTYATILSNIEAKGYVRKENRQYFSTELGEIINELLVKSFPSIINVEFTATMEDELDNIEDGKADWQGVLGEFYRNFKGTLAAAEKNMRNLKTEEVPTDEKCDKCGKPMVIKWGRNGRFIACSGYPECKSTKPLKGEGEESAAEPETTDQQCPKCSKPMVVKHGRFGKFLACSGYPECKTTKSITTGIKCPEADCPGEIVERRTKRGRSFFGCSAYPKCRFASWNRPVPEPCPNCGSKFLVVKSSKRSGLQHGCPNKECGFTKEIESA